MKLLEDAVYAQLSCDTQEEFLQTLSDVRNNGADAGFHGFISYSETCDFYQRNRPVILESLVDFARDQGVGVSEIVSQFECLEKQFSTQSIDAFLLGIDDTYSTQLANALAWFALEFVASYYEPADTDTNADEAENKCECPVAVTVAFTVARNCNCQRACQRSRTFHSCALP